MIDHSCSVTAAASVQGLTLLPRHGYRSAASRREGKQERCLGTIRCVPWKAWTLSDSPRRRRRRPGLTT
ncbi:hypothetical protein JMJ77_0015340 [Colletotrichum scovillei]|uniref:Uncharacterized protein n=1 Tax=Colletotrichum scovillei TaxID=1209932 RepID=A0A9P7R1K9_9PEZI|nr:hypothetical protein JMJ77_0015340 [Colletotrichum scovillei]KAG7056964.1 hypothetical protein JMJ78_0000750 [Colletotrichum scovillei]KAG7066854.1 hypothetical protein JMJ76_0000704 [Colletotrichum scovillei]